LGIGAGEVWTDLLPAIALVGAAQHALRAEIKGTRILWQKDERRGPGKPVFRMGLAKVADSGRRDVLGLSGAAIIAEQLAVSSTAIDDVGIGRVRGDVAALARARGMPVAESD